MSDLDKTFNQILKANIDLVHDNLIMEDAIMKSVYEKRDVRLKVDKLRRRAIMALRVAAVLLVVGVASVFRYGGQSMSEGMTDYYWMVSLIGVGLFYLMVMLQFTFMRERSTRYSR